MVHGIVRLVRANQSLPPPVACGWFVSCSAVSQRKLESPDLTHERSRQPHASVSVLPEGPSGEWMVFSSPPCRVQSRPRCVLMSAFFSHRPLSFFPVEELETGIQSPSVPPASRSSPTLALVSSHAPHSLLVIFSVARSQTAHSSIRLPSSSPRLAGGLAVSSSTRPLALRLPSGFSPIAPRQVASASRPHRG